MYPFEGKAKLSGCSQKRSNVSTCALTSFCGKWPPASALHWTHSLSATRTIFTVKARSYCSSRDLMKHSSLQLQSCM